MIDQNSLKLTRIHKLIYWYKGLPGLTGVIGLKGEPGISGRHGEQGFPGLPVRLHMCRINFCYSEAEKFQ